MRGRQSVTNALSAVSLGVMFMLAVPPVAAPASQVTSADDPALGPLLAAISNYASMRKQLLREVPALTPNSTASQITAASDALARAIQRARPKARPGDFFDKGASAVITRRVRDAVQASNLTEVLAGIDDEPPHLVTPRVHLRFPDAVQMATMPPSILAALPALPEGLEYRFVGRFLVLRDVQAAMILDYVAQVLPAK